MSNIEFEPISIFYGNNGKSTLLNILAKFYNANIQNNSSKCFIFDDYLNTLNFYNEEKLKAKEIKYITVWKNLEELKMMNESSLIYDLDSNPCTTKEYDELESIKVYKEFFKDS